MRALSTSLLALFAFAISIAACTSKPDNTVEGGIVMTTAEAAAPTGVTPTCLPCSAAAPAGWAFYNQYADAQCKTPVAQAVFEACADVNVPAQIEVTFGDGLGARKAGQKAQVNKTADVAGNTGVYRKNNEGACVAADVSAVKLAPAGCTGKKVCRNAAGELVCDGCATLSTGCPAYEQSLVRVSFEDKGAPAGAGGGGNAARLKQCCNQLAIQAKAMPNSPEGGLFQQAAAQCNAMAASLGPNGNAPELGAIKTLLAGRNIPAVCAGF
jgi:hypothetical protein